MMLRAYPNKKRGKGNQPQLIVHYQIPTDMKRLLMGMLFASGLFLTAQAQQYDFLTLRTATGSEQSFAANGLKITFSGGQAHFTSQGKTTSLALADLASMQFAATATSISSFSGESAVAVTIENGNVVVKNSRNAAVSVTGLDGRTYGLTNLPRGIYLVRVGSQTFKAWSK